MKLEAKTAGLIVIIFSALVVSFLIIFYFIWSQKYSQRVYAGVSIGSLDLSNQTYDQAKDSINKRLENIKNSGLKFQYNKKTAVLTADVTSFDSDLSYSTLSFEPEEMLAEAYGNKSDKTYFKFLINLLKTKKQKKIPVIYKLNEEAIHAFLNDNFPELTLEAKNAFFSASDKPTGQEQLKITPETPGKEINYDQAIREVKNNLDNLENGVIIIKTQSKYPKVKTSDLTAISSEAEKIINRGDITLTLPAELGTSTIKSWIITPKRIVTWISITEKEKTISLDSEKIKEYLKNYIAPQVDLEASLSRFEIKDGKVSSWQKGKSGQKLDLENNTSLINDQYLKGNNTIELVITEIPATENNEADLQIKEIIGTGHSVFTGSPANRRHNIQVGAAALHGLLINPGQEFSLLKALGNVDDKTGYLPELVIKGNKTVPEFGGGLCQIGTTVFRAALSSGLPITMRQNHSYRVAYYEPAGTDATIYIPSPDLRFVNDTNNYILIQARSVKSDLYFDFWGVKDGRVATTTYPVIYNIVEPEPTKIIESSDLKPGEKKCTEKSHNGADAYFDYTVTYPSTATGSIVKERRFKSHYVPWRAVCLVGKASTSTNSTSSNSIISNFNSSSPINSVLTNTSSLKNKKTTETPAVIKVKS